MPSLPEVTKSARTIIQAYKKEVFDSSKHHGSGSTGHNKASPDTTEIGYRYQSVHRSNSAPPSALPKMMQTWKQREVPLSTAFLKPSMHPLCHMHSTK